MSSGKNVYYSLTLFSSGFCVRSHSVRFLHELFYHFLSFTKLEESNSLKHCGVCIKREIMHSAIPQYMGHSSEPHSFLNNYI